MATGKATLFIPSSPILFEDASESEVTVSGGIQPGEVKEMGNGVLYLRGKKLSGSAPFIKGGNGILVVDGGGFSDQKVAVTNGVLQIGTGAQEEDALGDPHTPLVIKGKGALDLNYRSEGSVTNNSVNHITHGKEINVEGAGPDGKGAILNTGNKGNVHAFNTIRLTGDTTFSSVNRWGVSQEKSSPLSGRGSVTGATDTVLTVIGPMSKNDAHLSFSDTDLSFGSLRVADDGGVMFSYDTTVDLPHGIVISNGTIRSFLMRNKITPAVKVESDTVATIGPRGGALTFSGPITLGEGAVFDLNAGNVVLEGDVQGPGFVKVSGGGHNFCGNMAQDTLSVENGEVVYGKLGISESGQTLPRHVDLKNPGSALWLCPSADKVYEGLEVSGAGSFWPSCLESQNKAVSTLKNCRITPKTVKIGNKDRGGRAVFGEGTVVNTIDLNMGPQDEPKSTQLRIGKGAEVTISNTLAIAHFDSNRVNVHELIVDGGTLNVLKNPIWLGNASCRAYMVINGGTVNAPGFIIRRFLKTSANINFSHEILAMNGGSLSVGSQGFTTARVFPKYPQAYFYGGTLNAEADWSARKYQHLVFDRLGGHPEPDAVPFTLNVADKKVTFPTALQGRSRVVLAGTGSFISDTPAQGGVAGHWTVENTGVNCLNGAAAFSDGLTLAPECQATVNIASDRSFVNLGIFMNEPGGNRAKNFCTETNTYGMFVSRIRDFIPKNDKKWYITYAFEGEFKVDERMEYTFGVTYHTEARLSIDGTFVCANKGRTAVGTGTVALDPGWHRFKLTLLNENHNDAGPRAPGWGGMVAGWAKGRVSSTAAKDFVPFDTDTVEMRPATTLWKARIAAGPVGEWNSSADLGPCVLTDSMQAIHDPDWVDADKGRNEFFGRFLVEDAQAGLWTFEALFNDRIGLYIDGQTVVETEASDRSSTGSATLAAGWHTFRIRTYDPNGGGAQSGKPALSFTRPGSGETLPFDERNLRLVANPYGYIGGELVLGSESVLTNVADGPCRITGTVSGTGTLSGPFSFDKAVIETVGDSKVEQVSCVKIDQKPDSGALLKVGKIRVAFDKKPVLSRYVFGPAFGLEDVAPSDLQKLLEVVVPGETVPYKGVELAVEDRVLVMKNHRLGGMTLILE